MSTTTIPSFKLNTGAEIPAIGLGESKRVSLREKEPCRAGLKLISFLPLPSCFTGGQGRGRVSALFLFYQVRLSLTYSTFWFPQVSLERLGKPLKSLWKQATGSSLRAPSLLLLLLPVAHLLVLLSTDTSIVPGLTRTRLRLVRESRILVFPGQKSLSLRR